MATIKDVANRAGVSVATVSYVLNGTKRVSEAANQRVLEAASALNYRTNRSARALRTGQSQTIGLLVPDLINPYFPELAQAVSERARSLGYSVLLYSTGNELEAELEGIRLLEEHRVDGAIWVPVSDQHPGEMPFPVVVVDRPLSRYDGVSADHYQGGMLLAAYVMEKGHHRIGLLSGQQTLASARLRREGFVSSLKGASIVWEHEVAFSSSLSEEARGALLSRSASIAVCANDVVAINAIKFLGDASIRVPDDVSVVGFDDIPWSAVVRPELTTVRQPLAAIGHKAVEKLHYRMEHPGGAWSHESLPVNLIERETVGVMKGGRQS